MPVEMGALALILGETTTMKQEPGDPLDISPGLPHKGRTPDSEVLTE